MFSVLSSLAGASGTQVLGLGFPHNAVAASREHFKPGIRHMSGSSYLIQEKIWNIPRDFFIERRSSQKKWTVVQGVLEHNFQTRELLILEMWAGQMACEGLNWVLKHAIKEGRPHESPGDGYGFPSSHSQWMGYFSSFLILHLYFRHRFTSCGICGIGRIGLLLKVLWGAFIGTVIGSATYLALEYVPAHHPDSLLGQSRGVC
ncbi:hypothetical protein BU17DRAFT_71289 [Hysterangium stoloniferum]|nr:hypothetical protein BU17DRAFT_71289 [Hysterangium stoloniferum]